MNGGLEVSQRVGGVLLLGGGIGQLRGDIIELLPDGLIFLEEGVELPGYPA